MMKRIVPALALLLLALTGFGQNCTDCRYTTELFTSLTIDTVQFGEGENANGDNQELFMDVYQPVGDTMTDRPVLIFAFGGGFIQGDRWETHVVRTCERFAKAGYVAVAIDYRTGIDVTQILNADEEGMRVFFRPMMDMRASVQWLKYSVDSLGNPYNIDPDKIFIGGASSGGITAMMVEYCDRSEEIAEIADTNDAIGQYGGFMATSANGPHAAYDWEPFGVVSIAGALVKADWVEPGDKPVLMAHGDEDDTVPYEDENTLTGFLQATGITLEGSYLVDQEAQAEGVCSYLHTMEGEDHPSSGASDYYYDNIYFRLMPRMKALLEGKSFCCNHQVTIAGDTLVGIDSAGVELTFDSQLQNSQGGTTYGWCSFPCQETGDQSSITVYPQPDEHQYYIVTAEENNCVATDVVATEIAEPDTAVGLLSPTVASGELKLYPNPTTGGVQLILPDAQQTYQVQLFDLNGKRVQATQLGAGQNSLSLQLNSGTYLLQLTDTKGRHYRSTLQLLR